MCLLRHILFFYCHSKNDYLFWRKKNIIEKNILPLYFIRWVLLIPTINSKNQETEVIEKHIVLEDIDPLTLYGINNAHLQVIRSLFPKLRIMARDNVIRVLGDEEDMCAFEEKIQKIQSHILRYNVITDEDIVSIIKDGYNKADTRDDVIVDSISGKPIKSRSANQQKLVDSFYQKDMTFAIGPAGTGKTYLSIALAVRSLKEKNIRKIILSRPAVEAGEKLGFLPGDMKDKIDPYLQPLYDALEDMIPTVKLQDMIDKNVIQIAPLAFMRGRTLSDAIVILDEAQNTTSAQIRMFLTRMGWNTKMIITGDLTQVDLPRGQKSGLRDAVETLKDIDDIGIIHMTDNDIVRHKLVTKIVNAFEKKDRKDEQRTDKD